MKDRLLALLVQHPELQDAFGEDMIPFIETGVQKSSADMFLAHIAQSKTPLTIEALHENHSPEHISFLQHLLFQNEILTNIPVPHDQECTALIKEWRREHIHMRLEELRHHIRLCDEQGTDSSALIGEMQKLSGDLSALA